MFDLIIKNARPFFEDGCSDVMDIGIQDGKIAELAPNLQGPSKSVIDAGGCLAVPSFVDSHTHLDKVLVGEGEDAEGLMAAINLFADYQKSVPVDRIQEDVLKRAKKVVDMQVSHGTGTIKTHVIMDSIWGTHSVEALVELKSLVRDKADVKVIVPFSFDEHADLLESFARRGIIDFVGGYPTIHKQSFKNIDQIFAFALKHDLPIDLHVDESDDPDVTVFNYLLDKIIETGMQGRVSAGHVTALCAVDDDTAKRTIEKACKAQINVITLPSCNMYLMGRKDKQPIRRGVTRVDEFLKAGVNVAFASDNIRDPFRPFGNGDMLEEALFTAQVLQYGTTPKLEQILTMATYAPAKNTLLENYGLSKGCKADLVVLDAASPREAIIGQVAKKLILKNGVQLN